MDILRGFGNRSWFWVDFWGQVIFRELWENLRGILRQFCKERKRIFKKIHLRCTGLANSAFLKKGERNLNKSTKSWANIGQPFCPAVWARIRPKKTRCDTISSQAKAKPGAFAGRKIWSMLQYAVKTWKLIFSKIASGLFNSRKSIMKMRW